MVSKSDKLKAAQARGLASAKAKQDIKEGKIIFLYYK
jgi:hypothetical protein